MTALEFNPIFKHLLNLIQLKRLKWQSGILGEMPLMYFGRHFQNITEEWKCFANDLKMFVHVWWCVSACFCLTLIYFWRVVRMFVWRVVDMMYQKWMCVISEFTGRNKIEFNGMQRERDRGTGEELSERQKKKVRIKQHPPNFAESSFIFVW